MSFRSYGPKDDQPNDDGDPLFLRFATRGDGVDLPPGVLRYAQNLRLTDKTIKPRKGTKALATDIELTNPPVILDFTLGADLAVTSITRSGGTATLTTVANHGYATGDRVAVEHANQSAYNGDFTITVTGAKTFTYAVSGSPATPATGTITCNKGPRIFTIYDDVVRGSDVVTFDDNTDAFILAVSDRAWLCRAGVASVAIDYPAGEICSGPVSLVQFEGKVYLFRGSPGTAVAVTSITRSSTTATLTSSAAHGLTTGDWAYIEGGDQNDYRGAVQVTVTDTTHFTYTVSSSATTPATGTFTLKPCDPPLSWDRNTANDFIVAASGPHATGLAIIKLPPTDWAFEFNRRLWLPFLAKQLLGSDYSDALTIDTNVAQTRIKPGTNDWLVGGVGFSETRLLIAYRKSLHTATLTITDLTITGLSQVQAKFGCVARETLVECSGWIFFLTDGGVARLRITDELNLVADPLPLSDDIQNLFERVNWSVADKAVAAFHNNRYYIALPLDGATANNAVFVFSFLNGGGWESVDTFPGDFDIQALRLAEYQGRQRLHVITTFGALYLLEELEVDEFGATTEITAHPIAGLARTRYVRTGSSDVKRFLRALVEINLAAGDALTVSAALRNPDQTAELFTIAATATDDVTRRPRIGRRGVACSLEIATSAGRPEVKTYQLESSLSDRSSKSR